MPARATPRALPCSAARIAATTCRDNGDRDGFAANRRGGCGQHRRRCHHRCRAAPTRRGRRRRERTGLAPGGGGTREERPFCTALVQVVAAYDAGAGVTACFVDDASRRREVV